MGCECEPAGGPAPVRRGDRLRAAPRCGARTRAGTPCQAPRVAGRPRCRMHGGAAGSGGQKGNRNAWKTGYYGAAARLRRRILRKAMRDLSLSLRILAAERWLGTATALRLAADVDSDPGLVLPPEYDWRVIRRDAGRFDDPGDLGEDAAPGNRIRRWHCGRRDRRKIRQRPARRRRSAGCMGSMMRFATIEDHRPRPPASRDTPGGGPAQGISVGPPALVSYMLTA